MAGKNCCAADVFKELIAVTGIMSLIAVIFFYPLLADINNLVIDEPWQGDGILHLWSYEWLAHAITSLPVNQWFDANIFHPVRFTLAYCDIEYTQVVPYLLARSLAGTKMGGYNLLIIFWYIITGVCCHYMVRIPTGSRIAGVIFGTALAFGPFRTSTIIQLLYSLHWACLFLLLTVLLFRDRQEKWLIPLAAILALQLFSGLYYSLFLTVLFGFCLAYARLSGGWLPRNWRYIAVAGLLVTAAVVAVGIPLYYSSHTRPADRWDAPKCQLLLANFATYPQHTRLVYWLNDIPPGPYPTFAYAAHYPGTVLLCFFLCGAIRVIRSRKTYPLEAMVLFAVVAMTVAISAYCWEEELLHRLFPPLKNLRGLIRAGFIIMLGVTYVAAAEAARLFRRLRWRRVIGFVLLALVVAEGAPVLFLADAFRYRIRPGIYRSVGVDGAVVEYPLPTYDPRNMFPVGLTPIYIYYSIGSWYRLVDGYSGYQPAGHFARIELLKTFPSPESVSLLSRLGANQIILHTSVLPGAFVTGALAFAESPNSGWKTVASDGADILLRRE